MLKLIEVVRVEWVDGDSLTGEFVGQERGFILLKDSHGKIHPCLPAHLKKITPIKQEGKISKH